MKKKQWYHSRTIWFAVFKGIAGVLLVAATEYPEIGGLVSFSALVDALLRLDTTKEIK